MKRSPPPVLTVRRFEGDTSESGLHVTTCAIFLAARPATFACYSPALMWICRFSIWDSVWEHKTGTGEIVREKRILMANGAKLIAASRSTHNFLTRLILLRCVALNWSMALIDLHVSTYLLPFVTVLENQRNPPTFIYNIRSSRARVQRHL